MTANTSIDPARARMDMDAANAVVRGPEVSGTLLLGSTLSVETGQAQLAPIRR
ncbi:hypothetical protein EV643_12693 [Kribbella sp. VKM Ac-2527]|uniref:Uncharacterized protein n=1 Tax=Kribbella caucasensis TaxID=2512215 RepID=A0A4R6JFJ8_9ACTN|nr:hypothetical protein EV643_12693 [Kribbella sp. VKM Ac-2527]